MHRVARCGERSPSPPEIILPVVATAAWSIPKAVADRFPADGSALERYSKVFKGVEINSTFYRRHRPDTFVRWAGSVPHDFRFAVKMPKDITHAKRLEGIEEPFGNFLDDISNLGSKLGPLLCQLPPNLAFDPGVATPALTMMRKSHEGSIVIEPRHDTWASHDALALLEELRIHRVLADPAVIWTISDFEEPPRYIRLHGKPKLYYSAYSEKDIAMFRSRVAPDGWCVFDNTASGAAAENALAMLLVAETRTLLSD
jgi:uncharacterized protein YecE (DUF72 family)